MSKYQDDNREIEIQMVMSLIQSMCIKNNISLVPYILKNGTYITAIHDHLEDAIYALTKNKNEEV